MRFRFSGSKNCVHPSRRSSPVDLRRPWAELTGTWPQLEGAKLLRAGPFAPGDVLQEAKVKLSPRTKGKMPKLYYGTQLGTHPPTILVFVNEPKLFKGQYERYLANVLRERFDLHEALVPGADCPAACLFSCCYQSKDSILRLKPC